MNKDWPFTLLVLSLLCGYPEASSFRVVYACDHVWYKTTHNLISVFHAFVEFLLPNLIEVAGKTLDLSKRVNLLWVACQCGPTSRGRAAAAQPPRP